MPRIFSVRSLSSSPPNQIWLPFSSSANQSVLFIVYRTPGKHSFITFGKVSRTTDDLTALNRNRITAWRLSGAFSALMQTFRMWRKVLPLRLPPNSIRCVAGPARRFCASCCLALSLKPLIRVRGADQYRAAAFAGYLQGQEFRVDRSPEDALVCRVFLRPLRQSISAAEGFRCLRNGVLGGLGGLVERTLGAALAGVGRAASATINLFFTVCHAVTLATTCLASVSDQFSPTPALRSGGMTQRTSPSRMTRRSLPAMRTSMPERQEKAIRSPAFRSVRKNQSLPSASVFQRPGPTETTRARCSLNPGNSRKVSAFSRTATTMSWMARMVIPPAPPILLRAG